MGKPSKSGAMPLQLVIEIEPFDKWGLDFICPIRPSRKHHQHILVCTDYCTKWVEVKTMMKATAKNVAIFLYEEMFTRYDVPRELVSDRGTPFVNQIVNELTKEYQIRHRKSTPYYPKANGQVEVTNKELEHIITKSVTLH